MTAANYDACLKKTLVYEGGYTNNPADPGGPTNWGITIADARMYWKKDATAADVKAMPLSVAKEIYRKHYWDAVKGDDLPDGLDLAVFDFAVNSGVSRSLNYLKLYRTNDAAESAARICDERLRFLKGLKTWPTFGKGWERRVVDVRKTALTMAASIPPTDIQKPSPAPHADPVPQPAKSGGFFVAILAALAAIFKRK